MWFNVVILVALVLAVGCEGRSIGDFISSIRIRLPSNAFPPHNQPKSPPSPFSPSKPPTNPVSSIPECRFVPHPSSSSPPSSDMSIPTHAWPHISTLLTSNTQNLLPPSPPDPFHRSRVHTLRLKDIVDDVSLEGVVVGLVYTAPETSDRELELRDEKLEQKSQARSTTTRRDWERFKYHGSEDSEDEDGEIDRMCLSEAIRGVASERIMEGVLELSGGKGGRVGFLVYRVD